MRLMKSSEGFADLICTACTSCCCPVVEHRLLPGKVHLGATWGCMQPLLSEHGHLVGCVLHFQLLYSWRPVPVVHSVVNSPQLDVSMAQGK
jgi:hypothetical protein